MSECEYYMIGTLFLGIWLKYSDTAYIMCMITCSEYSMLIWITCYLHWNNRHSFEIFFCQIQKRHLSLTENGRNRAVRYMVREGWTITGVARIGQTAATKLYQLPVTAPPTTGLPATGTVNKLTPALSELAAVSGTDLCLLRLAAAAVFFPC